jgi:hypothetical protein
MTSEAVPTATPAPVAAVPAATIITPPDSEKSPEDGEDCGCGDETKVAPTTNALPTASELKKIDDLPLLDAEGNEHSFRSVYASPDADKHLVIFVRHFFCGVRYFVLCCI